jgi:valyl-tRNA synthetase
MIMLGLFCMDGLRDRIEDRIPFRYVYLHGMVRDEDGRKMSKTKGNVVDPVALIETYGTDALRFNLITSAGTGQDQRLWEEKVEAGRNFANKLWNAARFVILQLDASAKIAPPSIADRASLPVEDRWILSRLDRLVADCDQLIGGFQLNEAGHRMYDFLWNEFCDWYVEMAKVRLREGQGPRAKGQGGDPRPVLVHVLETGLRLLHPYMPYVTEELWQRLRPFLASPRSDAGSAEPVEALIVAPYPEADAAWRDEEAEGQVEGVIEIVRAIRNIRSEKQVEPARKIVAYVVTAEANLVGTAHIEALARVELHVVPDAADAPREGVATAVLPHAKIVVPLAGLLDVGAERARLEKEIAETEQYLQRVEAKLSNEQFRSKAPASVVAAEEERRASAHTRIEGLRRALAELGA